MTVLYEADLRWYSPSLARWITIDPLLYAAGDNNFYCMVGNNPVNWVDPSGLEAVKGTIDIPGDKKRGINAAKVSYEIDLSGCCMSGDEVKEAKKIVEALKFATLTLRGATYDIEFYVNNRQKMGQQDQASALSSLRFRVAELVDLGEPLHLLRRCP